jgi:YidC/Oxa1 family membrane protein insertase
MIRMIASIFHTIIYLPLYNGLIFLIGIVPGQEVGLAVILLTIIVRVLMFPIAQTAIKSQIAMRAIAPELEEIKRVYKDKQEQAAKTFALYKERKINLGASFYLLIIQVPIFLGLYWVFLRGGLPIINEAFLYPFVNGAVHPNMLFLGLIDMASHSIPLAILAGVAQFTYAKLSLPKPAKDGSGFAHDMAKSMHVQMLYVLPVVMIFIAYTVSAAAALYLTTGSLMSIAQELFIKRRMQQKAEK